MTGKDVVVAGALAVLLGLGAGCGKDNNSADTDKASEQLRAAQTSVTAQRQAVVSEADALEQRKRELAAAQQAIAEREAKLLAETNNLGSAQGSLATAQAAYRAAVDQRLAKLDAGLAALATRTDAAARDASAGLAARRKLLADRLHAMTATPEAGWSDYTRDVDTTFDAIERDLAAASK